MLGPVLTDTTSRYRLTSLESKSAEDALVPITQRSPAAGRRYRPANPRAPPIVKLSAQIGNLLPSSPHTAISSVTKEPQGLDQDDRRKAIRDSYDIKLAGLPKLSACRSWRKPDERLVARWDKE